nr:hypothetical protein [Streptomyces formicae]
MSASERDVQPQPHGLPVPGPSRVAEPARFSMSDLLASCAAASVVSTPPSDPDPRSDGARERRRPSG